MVNFIGRIDLWRACVGGTDLITEYTSPSSCDS